jgi:hypothetical protein
MRRKSLGEICSLRLFLVSSALLALALAQAGTAQSVPYERAFPQSRVIVEKRIKESQSSAGRLPVLDGFTVPGDQPLSRFQRGYYQCVTQVISTPSGGSLVRVSATITAWYTDPAGKSGYQVLPSNGRLENDFLDRLQQALGDGASPAAATAGTKTSAMPAPKNKPATPEPTLSAPRPGDPAPIVKSRTGIAPSDSPFHLGDPLDTGHLASLATQKAMIDKHTEEQEKEANALEEILHNQAHPGNLAAVTKAKTPVLASPSQDAQVLFLAAAEDEFEILDSNPNWVHVRISGLSRGWIRRSSVEMPKLESGAQPVENHKAKQTRNRPTVAEPEAFQVQGEQIASFPGDWAPLRGKTVSIISVQKTDSATDTGSAAKLAFAKFLFDKAYADVAKGSMSVDGVVVIFDSADGGMTAATVPVLRQWKAGTLSEEAFWRRCFFDPADAFNPSPSPSPSPSAIPEAQ